jgi:hypothetical protein
MLLQAFNKVEMKQIDKSHPMAICNGDLQFLDIIKKDCKDIDILGTNVYRGVFWRCIQKVKRC